MHRYRSLKSPSKYYGWSALAVFTTSVSAFAAHADDPNWQLHGALTQGVVYTSDNNFYGASDDAASLKLTEISFNASARLRSNLRAAGEVIYRQTGEQGEGGGIDYAFLDYQFFSEAAFATGIRGGRYKLPIGLYNETRDNAFARPSIYVPQSGYPDRVRDLQLSSDGVLLYTNIFTHSGQWTLELDAGKPRVDKQNIGSLLNFGAGKVDSVGQRSNYGGRIMYQSSDGTWLGAVSYANLHIRYLQALQPTHLTDINVELDDWQISLQYNIDQWTFTGEYGLIDVRVRSDQFRIHVPPLFYYLQATRHLDKHWSIYSRYDTHYLDRHDPSGSTYAALAGGNKFANFTYDAGFGVRCDINKNAMISAEYHYIDGTSWVDNSNGATRYWNMLAVELSYRF